MLMKCCFILLMAFALFAQSRPNWAQQPTPEEQSRWELIQVKQEYAVLVEMFNAHFIKDAADQRRTIQAQEQATADERLRRQYWQELARAAEDRERRETQVTTNEYYSNVLGLLAQQQKQQRTTNRLLRALDTPVSIYGYQDPWQGYNLNNLNNQLGILNQQLQIFNRPQQPLVFPQVWTAPSFNGIKAAGQR